MSQRVHLSGSVISSLSAVNWFVRTRNRPLGSFESCDLDAGRNRPENEVTGISRDGVLRLEEVLHFLNIKVVGNKRFLKKVRRDKFVVLLKLRRLILGCERFWADRLV